MCRWPQASGYCHRLQFATISFIRGTGALPLFSWSVETHALSGDKHACHPLPLSPSPPASDDPSPSAPPLADPSTVVKARHVSVVDRPAPQLLVNVIVNVNNYDRGAPLWRGFLRASFAAVGGCPWRACMYIYHAYIHTHIYMRRLWGLPAGLFCHRHSEVHPRIRFRSRFRTLQHQGVHDPLVLLVSSSFVLVCLCS